MKPLEVQFLKGLRNDARGMKENTQDKIKETTKRIIKNLLLEEADNNGWTEEQKIYWWYKMIEEKLSSLIEAELKSFVDWHNDKVLTLEKPTDDSLDITLIRSMKILPEAIEGYLAFRKGNKIL